MLPVTPVQMEQGEHFHPSHVHKEGKVQREDMTQLRPQLINDKNLNFLKLVFFSSWIAILH